jgi:hypothetical protein
MKRYKILYDKKRNYTQLRPLKYTKLIDIRLKGINWRFKNAQDRNRLRVLIQQLTKNGKTNLAIKLLKKTIHELKIKQTKRRGTGLLYILRGIKKLELLTELRAVKKRGRVRYHKVKLTHPQKSTSKAVQALLIFCRQEAKRTRIPFHLVMFEEFKDLWTYQSRLYRARRDEVKEIMETKFRHTFEKKQKLDINFILAPRKKTVRVKVKEKFFNKIKHKTRRFTEQQTMEYHKRKLKRALIFIRKNIEIPQTLKWGLKRFLKQHIYTPSTYFEQIMSRPIILKERLLYKKIIRGFNINEQNKEIKLNLKNFFNKIIILIFLILKKKYLKYIIMLKIFKIYVLNEHKKKFIRYLVGIKIPNTDTIDASQHKEIIKRKQIKKHVIRPNKHGESRYLAAYKYHERLSFIVKQERSKNIQEKEYLNHLKKIKKMLNLFKKKRKC